MRTFLYAAAFSFLVAGSAAAQYLGNLSNNPALPPALPQPPNTFNNPFGAGSPYAPDSPNNRFGQGMGVYGPQTPGIPSPPFPQ